ncbi:hypothetical protein BpHYR1_010483 [Brachionus plicatilis]|uniref:Uncharacterized protein n=1 Tax=Brachionus plicatilis TaxID=10195 RepID=A0A3M7QZY5_BRAPC|nr:hypothetical protein BpHYR1_010483 [Brachionus plicatilis]
MSLANCVHSNSVSCLLAQSSHIMPGTHPLGYLRIRLPDAQFVKCLTMDFEVSNGPMCCWILKILDGKFCACFKI